ncbi:MBG domain-containing protein [Rhodocista pekingensis]|uniref:MBG domain-containing protein n=1 Tax=Rhodocista pekingensis TaxID=201185 RepID=A0ABW2KRE4_9PROT
MTMNNPPRRRKASVFRAHLLGCTAVLSVVQALSGAAWAQSSQAPGTLPTGGQVQSGVASIATTGTAMTVNQTTDKAIISWNQFNIGSGASVTFQQPNTSSMTLNRVRGGETSLIEGALRAPGTVILVNPSGVVFGGGSTVDVGGIIASTLDIADEDFEKGNLSFTRGTSDGAIVNQGRINARGGSVALLASQITNLGYIRAELGSVVLAAGETVTLTPDGGAPLKVDASLIRAEIEAGGIIQTGGGAVYLSAQAMNKVNAGVIRATGVIEADSLTDKGGQIVLDASGPITLQSALFSAKGATGGGTVLVGDAQATSVAMDAKSRIDASATESGKGGTVIVNSQDTVARGVILARGGKLWGDGGFVETSGHELAFDGIKVDVGAAAGKGGNWLLDPYDLTVNAAYASAIQAALESGNVTLQTTNTAVNNTGVGAGGTTNASGNGDIFVNSGITWTSANSLTLDAYRGVTVNAAMSGSSLSVVTNNGGSGGRFAANAPVDLTTGLDINGTAYTMITSAADLAAISATGSYALASNLTLSGAWTPIGFNSTGANATPTFAFGGTLDGLGHTISGLTLSQAGWSNIGLFSTVGSTGSLANLVLTGATISGGVPSSATTAWGFLSGRMSGTVFNSSVNGTITGSRLTGLGGLVGVLNGGTILNSRASITSANGSGVTALGGLAGQATANSYISDSYANINFVLGMSNVRIGGVAGDTNVLTLLNSYSTGTITATTSTSSLASYVGGLVGINLNGTIANANSAVNIGLQNASTRIGGLVGSSSGLITNSYATGNITLGGTGNQYVGGLVGVNSQTTATVVSARVFNSYATGDIAVGNAAATNASAQYIGGLAGHMQNGVVSGSFASGTVSVGRSATYVGGLVGSAEAFNLTSSSVLGSFATGRVVGGSVASNVGGLVGRVFGSIVTGAYSTGSVTAGVGSTNIGGLIGQVATSGTVLATVANVWSGSPVTAATGVSVGGLVGLMASSTVLNSYWDTSSTGQLNAYGTSSGGSFSATSVSGTDAFSSATYSNFDFTSIWYQMEGYTRPFLRTENQGTILNAHQLQAIAINPSGSYVLGANINMAELALDNGIWNPATGFAPVALSGTLNGQGYTISGLTINQTASGSLGLFSTIGAGGSVSNLTLTGASVTGGGDYLGLLAGQNLGTVSGVSVSGTVTASGSSIGSVGGLVGENQSVLSGSHAATSIVVGDNAVAVGGLIGRNTGDITGSYANSSVIAGSGAQQIGGLVGSNSAGSIYGGYATGSIASGDGSSRIGGLVGTHVAGGLITKAYSTVDLSIGASATSIGGLVGINTNSTISTSYAANRISVGADSSSVSGLVGSGSGSAIIIDSFWDATRSGLTVGSTGVSTSGTVAGLSTAEWFSNGPLVQSVFSSNDWVQGYPYPILKALPYITLTGSGTSTYGQAPDSVSIVSAIDQNGNSITSGLSTVGLTWAPASANASVGTATLGGSGASYSGGLYQFAYDGTLTITPAALTITASGVTKTYGNSVNVTGYTTSGLVTGDSIDGVTLLPSGGTGTAANAGSYTISASGATGTGLSNYSITYVNGTLVVAPAALTITANGATKTYGNSINLTGFTSNGLINGDSISAVSLTSTGAGTAANAGSHEISASGATGTGLSNYSITYATGTLVVNPAPLTITASGATKTYGTSAGLTGFTSNGLINGDTVTAVTLTSGGAGTAATVGSYSIVGSNATGTGLSNYSITYANGTLTVNPAALTITASGATKTYGASAGLTGFTSNGLVNGDTVTAVTLTSGGAGTAATVGSYSIVGSNATGTGLSNYSITYANGTLTVNPAALTITASDAIKGYGSTISLTGYSANGLVNGDSISAVALASDGSAANASIGNYAIQATGATGTGLSNYSITYAAGTLTVGKAILTVKATDAAKTYGSIGSLSGFTITGLLDGDNVSTVTLSSGGLAGTAAVGSYAINASNVSGSGLDNYAITYVGGTLTVTPAPLTITASGATKTYGTSAGLTGFTSNGLVNGDTVTAVTLTSGGAGTAATVGSYSIVGSNATGTGLSNYSITYANGTLTVNPAALTITASGATKTYGASAGLTGFTSNGLINGDTVTAVTLTSGGADAAANVGSYGIVGSNATGTGLSNYSITYVDGTLVVDPAALTITASDAIKSYGSTISLTGYSANGLVNGDSISAVALASDGSAANASIGNYAIQATGATGTGLSNYSITYAAGTLTVGKAILTVKATDAAKIYGSIGSLSGFTISGLLDGDNVSTVTLSSGGLAGTAAVGSYAINASNVSGSGLDNYAITYVGGTLTVTPAPLTIAASGATKTYGTSAGLTGFSAAGLLNGDSIGSVALSSAGTGTAATVGSYAVTASGATGTGLSNYAITYADGTLVVTPAALIISAGNATKTYGTSAGLTGFSAAGLLNGDSIGSVALSSAGTGTAATVGSYAVTASGATGTGLSNYAITYADGTLVVTPAALTISAGNASKVAGSDLSLTAFSAAGLVNGDAVSSVTLSSPGTPASAVAGTYEIVASNAAGTGLGNYTIRYQDGQLTVTPAASTLTTSAVQRIVVAAVATPAVTIAATSTPAPVSTAGTPAATSSASSSTASSTTGSSSSSSSGTATENGGGNGGGASATTAETGTASGTTGGSSANGEALPILVGGGDGGEIVYSQIQMTSNPIKGKESDERQQ